MERGNKVSTVLNYVSNFIEKYLTVPEIYASDIVEIVIMSVAIYYVVLWFKKKPGMGIIKGYFCACNLYACGFFISFDNTAMDI